MVHLALDWLSAVVLKNLLFVGAFQHVYVEWAIRYVEPHYRGAVPADHADAEPESRVRG